MTYLFEKQYYYTSKYFKTTFKKWSSWESQAILSVTMVQFFIILNIIVGIYFTFFPEVKRKFKSYEIIIFLALFFLIEYNNNKLYKGKYDELDKRWGNQLKKKKIIDIIVIVLVIIFSWGFVFINSWIFSRYKN